MSEREHGRKMPTLTRSGRYDQNDPLWECLSLIIGIKPGKGVCDKRLRPVLVALKVFGDSFTSGPPLASKVSIRRSSRKWSKAACKT